MNEDLKIYGTSINILTYDMDSCVNAIKTESEKKIDDLYSIDNKEMNYV